MENRVCVAGVLKIDPYVSGAFELKQAIESILGQQWTAGIPKDKMPTAENDKLPKDRYGSLAYNINAFWQFEYDDNGQVSDRYLKHLVVVFHGELNDNKGSDIKDWFGEVVFRIGKLPVVISSGVLTYNDNTEFTTALVVMKEQEKDTDMLVKWKYRLEELKVKGESNELGL